MGLCLSIEDEYVPYDNYDRVQVKSIVSGKLNDQDLTKDWEMESVETDSSSPDKLSGEIPKSLN